MDRMARQAPESECIRCCELLGKVCDHEVLETGVILPSDDLLHCLRTWEQQRDHSEVLFCDLEYTAEDTPRSLFLKCEELTETKLEAIVQWWATYALTSIDHKWTIYRDVDHQMRFAGPDELYRRLTGCRT